MAIPRNSRNGINHAIISILPTMAERIPSATVICHLGKRVSSVETTSVPWNILPALPVTQAKINNSAAGRTAPNTAIAPSKDP